MNGKIVAVAFVGLWVWACAPTVNEKERATARIDYDLAVAALNRGDMREALRNLMAASELDPTMAEVQNVLGLVYHDLGKPDDALRHHQKAVKLRPDFSEAHNNFGTLLTDIGRFGEAIEQFKIALADILYATPFLAEGNMGWAYYRQGDVDKALKHLGNAVATSPTFCRGYNWLARIALDRNQPEQVLANVRRFDKYCGKDATVAAGILSPYVRAMRYYSGLASLKLGNRVAAKEAFRACAGPDAENDFGEKCQRALRELE
jgi:type IV pilus assembly protein PilF